MIRRLVADGLAHWRLTWLWRFYPRRLKAWLWLNAELDGRNRWTR